MAAKKGTIPPQFLKNIKKKGAVKTGDEGKAFVPPAKRKPGTGDEGLPLRKGGKGKGDEGLPVKKKGKK